jgi:hypothetical protein
MGMVRPLDELGEELLKLELTQRAKSRAAGVCDYCGKGPTTPLCRFPRRHRDPRIGVLELTESDAQRADRDRQMQALLRDILRGAYGHLPDLTGRISQIWGTSP